MPIKADHASLPAKVTDRECAAVLGFFNARDSREPRVMLKVTAQADGLPYVGPNHADAPTGTMLIQKATGTLDFESYRALIMHLVAIARAGGTTIDEAQLNALLASVMGIEPRDPVESMLAQQMAVVHAASMKAAARLAEAKSLQAQDLAERAFTKLTRTFATQVETLKRYRTGGAQVVTVQHVTVNDGGQAVVANSVGAPGGSGE